MRTVVVICQKGGVGKTTTALNMAAGLTNRKKKVLLVDLDAQANLSATLECGQATATSFDLITGGALATDIIQPTAVCDVVPAGPNLSGADMSIKGDGAELFLSKSLHTVRDKYDYCVIDTPPALGLLTVSALTAADDAVVTVQADPYSLQALGQLALTLSAVRQHTNKSLKVAGVLLTRFSPRSILSRDMADMIEQTASALDTTVFKATIREAIAIKESQATRQSIFQYAPKSAVAEDYRSFVSEYLTRTK